MRDLTQTCDRDGMAPMVPEPDIAWAESLMPGLKAKFAAELGRIGARIPYIARDGLYRDFMEEVDPAWWTNGFWPGILWQMYHVTGAEEYKQIARCVENTLAGVVDEDFLGLHHDVGFMWLLSAVADWRLTGSLRAKSRGLLAANLLAGRFNPDGRYIRAWNEPDSEGWAIVDSMLNIPLLFWASEETGDPRFASIARMHANTLLSAAIRADGSCNHIMCFDPRSGTLLETPGGQGYGAGSSWSRGQSWGLYGYAIAARHTEDPRYLAAAKQVAHYFCANVALENDLSLSDFRAPETPRRWDALADVIAASGLLEIADQVPVLEQSLYRRWAVRILRAVASNWCDWEPSRDGLIQHCSGSYHREDERELPMVYADYFFLEAILRLQGKAARLW